MNQEADIGVGISVVEGMQAVMASDFAITQFRFLERLLVIHGHWCYKRIAQMVIDCKMERDEKEAFREKSKDVDKLLSEKAFMECSLSSLNDEIDGLRDTVKKFQDSCHSLKDEKSILIAEKSTLLSQLQIITESMQKLLEKNTLLEKSLSDAKIELEGLRAKSSSLEDFCNLLNNEKCSLLSERSILVSQLESVEEKLSNLEKRFTKLEEKYSYMEKDKESRVNEVEELHALLLAQKEKHANHKHSSEARLANLENLVLLLQEERQLGKIEFEEELDKAVNAQVEMFVLQKCMEDESAAKSLEIEQMTGRVSVLESEIGGLKGQLSAYVPVISSLKEDFASLEHAVLRTNKSSAACNQEQKDAIIETCLRENINQSSTENESTLIPDGVSDLLGMKARIRAVEKCMAEEMES